MIKETNYSRGGLWIQPPGLRVPVRSFKAGGGTTIVRRTGDGIDEVIVSSPRGRFTLPFAACWLSDDAVIAPPKREKYIPPNRVRSDGGTGAAREPLETDDDEDDDDQLPGITPAETHDEWKPPRAPKVRKKKAAAA